MLSCKKQIIGYNKWLIQMLKDKVSKTKSMKVAVCKNKTNKHKWIVRNVKSKQMIEK